MRLDSSSANSHPFSLLRCSWGGCVSWSYSADHGQVTRFGRRMWAEVTVCERGASDHGAWDALCLPGRAERAEQRREGTWLLVPQGRDARGTDRRGRRTSAPSPATRSPSGPESERQALVAGGRRSVRRGPSPCPPCAHSQPEAHALPAPRVPTLLSVPHQLYDIGAFIIVALTYFHASLFSKLLGGGYKYIVFMFLCQSL